MHLQFQGVKRIKMISTIKNTINEHIVLFQVDPAEILDFLVNKADRVLLVLRVRQKKQHTNEIPLNENFDLRSPRNTGYTRNAGCAWTRTRYELLHSPIG
jgi:hypothetical protein